MRRPARLITAASAVATVLGALAFAPQAVAQQKTPSAVEQGKQIAFNRKLGNCLACHKIAGGQLPGNIGPPLVNMKSRFASKAALRAQIWNPSKNNPNTIMPLFGKYHILTKDQINKVVDFVWTL